MKRAALYVRVSTQEQKNHGLSVDNQIQALKEYCENNGYIISGIYNDAGISARKKYTRRPALLDLMEDCKQHKIDIILFTKLDRWFRSVGDYYEVQKVLDENKVPWRAIWEDYETETSSGIFKVNIMLSVAQSEADRTSERLRDTFAYKRAKGDYLGNNVTGYIRKNRGLEIDPIQYPHIKAFFKCYAQSRNMTEALSILHNAGIMVTAQTARRMIDNPVYKGEANCGHKCEPYLTEEEWNKLQTVKRITTKSNNPNQIYLFTGLIICNECGKRMTGGKYPNPNKTGDVYRYYRCKSVYDTLSCTNRNLINESKLEAYLLENLDTILNGYIIQIKNIKNIDDKESKIKQLESKLKRVGDRYEDGDITKEEYKNKRLAIMEEINQLKSEIIPLKKTPEPLPSNWKEIYKDMDRKHQRTFWSSIISDIKVIDNKYEITFI